VERVLHSSAVPRRRTSRVTWVVLIATTLGGCVVRTAATDHHVGPTLFRTRTACEEGTRVSQVVNVGLVAEMGRQWGVVVGASDRLAARSAGDCTDPAQPQWRSPITVPLDPDPQRWTFSPLYVGLSAAGDAPLVRRSMVGLQAAAGSELTALSLGFTTRMLVRPPDDAFCAVRVHSHRPLETRVIVWTGVDAPPGALDAPQQEGTE
jgi:hypothetical protein